ncbi:MAG: hypothetical protein KAQ83_03415 [Nanoarchaeota archaeon]|nr:hypothetical protein [Nanoarchaeota archaeon]
MKRGEVTTTQIFTIGEIILALSVVAFLYLFAQHVLDDTTFERSVLSKDQAFLLDTIQSQPINNQLFYSTINLEKYSFCYAGNKLQVFENGSGLPIYHPFFTNRFLTPSLGYLPNDCIEYVNDNIYFEKSAETIIVENKQSTGKFPCPYKNIQITSILLDPLNDFNNPGNLISDTSKSSYEINTLIINSLYDYITARNSVYSVEKTRDLSSPQLTLEEKQIKISENNLIIILNTLTTSTNKEFARIYYNGNSINSSYLACKLANQLYLNGLDTIIIPKNSEIKQTSFDLLNQRNKITIYIEIYTKDKESIISDYPQISEAIGNAIV